MLNKSSLALLLALFASACTREVYLQRVPCVDCEPEPKVEEVCPEEEPVQEVYKVYDQVPVPAPAPACPTCVVPTCVVFPCPVMVPVCPTCYNYTYTYAY